LGLSEKDQERLKWLANTYVGVVKLRVAVGNIIRTKKEVPYLILDIYEALVDYEKELKSEMKEIVELHPAWEFLENTKGIGFTLACRLLAHLDIRKARHISSFWKFAGFGVTDGRADRKVKGKKLEFNKKLKDTCWLIGRSLLILNPSYSEIYDKAKEYYRVNRDWNRMRIHKAAMRKMIKVFLANLWLYWREREGLPISMPYAVDKLGHKLEYQELIPKPKVKVSEPNISEDS